MMKMSKPHAYLQTKNKQSLNIQKDRNKIVGGVALIMYPLIVSDLPKMTKFTSFKTKNKLGYIHV